MKSNSVLRGDSENTACRRSLYNGNHNNNNNNNAGRAETPRCTLMKEVSAAVVQERNVLLFMVSFSRSKDRGENRQLRITDLSVLFLLTVFLISPSDSEEPLFCLRLQPIDLLYVRCQHCLFPANISSMEAHLGENRRKESVSSVSGTLSESVKPRILHGE